MSLWLQWILVALFGLPALAAGFAFTTFTPDGIEKNQTSGHPIVWNNPQQSFTFNLNNKGPEFAASATSAMEEWNGENTSLQYRRETNDAQTCAVDGFNSAGWGATTCNGRPFGDALAVTTRIYTQIGGTWYLSEADIVFDQSRNWQIYTGRLARNAHDFHRVILHELGHALGLEHPDDAGQTTTAIMNSHTSNIDTLQSDDKNGIAYLYSGNSTNTSSSASQFGNSDGSGGSGGDISIPLLVLAAAFLRRAYSSTSIQQAPPRP